MSGVLQTLLGSLAGAIKDTYFKYVTLLLHGDGTNGAQNNTFLDGSTNNFTITRNGNTTQGSFSPFSQTGWSNYFDGTGDYFTVANNAAFNMGANSFTLEAFIYLTATPGAANPYGGVIIDKDGLSGTSWSQYALSVDLNRKAVFQASSVPNVTSPTAVITGATTLALGTWYHIAVTRVGTSATLWVNGISDGTTSSVPATLNSATRSLFIGWTDRGAPDSAYNFPGYISNLRIVKGTAVYTSNFTPPTAPLTAITNTSLLTCQSNRFIDNSSNAFAITRNGDVRVEAFSPFNPSTTYSTANVGGSGYFDGTGDNLSAASNAAFDILSGGDFTVECWFYANSLPSNSAFGSALISRDNTGATAGFIFRVLPTALEWVYPGLAANSQSFTFVTNTWYHVAAVRSSGAFRLYINGTQYSPTYSDRTADSATALVTGASSYTVNTAPFTGYISNARIVKGTAVYTANFTPPTAPLTAVTNTSLLLNFTNGGIFDNASQTVLETVGNAQVSTTQKKFGTGSMYFDGTDDRLVMPARPPMAVGSGNFTIEGWVYRLDTNVRGVFQLSGTAGGLQANTTTNLALGSDAGSVWRIYANNSAYNSTATWAINTWYHFALVRNSGTTTLYINGTSVISQADTVNYTGQNLCIGGFYNTTFLMNGYIDDLRITNGYARYTTNFTPPSSAFPNN